MSIEAHGSWQGTEVIKEKAVKVIRYVRARCKSASAIPFFWHVGRPNFGDDINPALFRGIAGGDVRLEIRRDVHHFLGMGSVLSKATGRSIVLGSGFLSDPAGRKVSCRKAVVVRGELSRAALTKADGVLLGDPMVLINLFVPKTARRMGEIGFVPHVSEWRQAERMNLRGLRIIDPGASPWRVIREIAECGFIFSQSLHGLVVADALEIPNIWISPSEKMAGGRFKFDDYLSTLSAAKHPHPFSRDVLLETPHSVFGIGEYKYCKRQLREAIEATVRDSVSQIG